MTRDELISALRRRLSDVSTEPFGGARPEHEYDQGVEAGALFERRALAALLDDYDAQERSRARGWVAEPAARRAEARRRILAGEPFYKIAESYYGKDISTDAGLAWAANVLGVTDLLTVRYAGYVVGRRVLRGVTSAKGRLPMLGR